MLLKKLLEIVIENMMVVASIGRNQKVKVVAGGLFGTSLMIDNSAFPGISRRWRGDSRRETIALLTEMITETIQLRHTLRMLSQSGSPEYVILFDDLERVLRRVPGGLINMTETYSDDQETVNDLSSLRGTVESLWN